MWKLMTKLLPRAPPLSAREWAWRKLKKSLRLAGRRPQWHQQQQRRVISAQFRYQMWVLVGKRANSPYQLWLKSRLRPKEWWKLIARWRMALGGRRVSQLMNSHLVRLCKILEISEMSNRVGCQNRSTLKMQRRKINNSLETVGWKESHREKNDKKRL